MDWLLRVGSARKSSPCGVKRIGKREKVRPARQKWPIFGVFGLAGRTFSRFGQDGGAIGRVFSRGAPNGGTPGELCRGLGGVGQCRCFHVCMPGRRRAWIGCCVLDMREKVRPARQKWPIWGVFGLAGRTFSRFCQNEAAVGRVFSRFGQDEAAVGRTFSRFSTAQRTAQRSAQRAGQASDRPATPAISR